MSASPGSPSSPGMLSPPGIQREKTVKAQDLIHAIQRRETAEVSTDARDMLSTKQKALEALQAVMDEEKASHHEYVMDAIESMKKYVKEPDVQQKGTYTMAYLAVSNRQIVLELGGHKAVVAAMRAHPAVERVQVEGCECLGRLAIEEDEAEQIIEAGGLQAVMVAMQNFEESLRVSEEALNALKALCEHDSADVIRWGGLEQIIRIMAQDRKATWVHHWGCRCLSYLAAFDAEAVKEAGGFEFVRTSCIPHMDVPSVRESAQEALSYDPDKLMEVEW